MEHHIIVLLVSICEIGKWNTIKGLHSQGKSPMEEIQAPDFDNLVKAKTFVDKTLLIKEIIKSPHYANLILCPRKFGKTTNMNMIKRFCEIDVDGDGNPKEKTLASSYAVFNDKRLKIFKDEDFVNEHFASYPVLYLDYSSLHYIDSYENLYEKLIILLSKTFTEHKYLLKNESLWAGFEKGLFKSYLSAQENHKDHNTHIITSAKWLSEILHKHFGRKVLVIIDDFDAYVYNAIFKDSRGVDKTIKLMMEVDGSLLRKNDHISKVILTGSLKVYREDMNKDIWTYHFQEDHPFSPYYGLINDELENLLSKLSGHCGEKYELQGFIKSFYGSYKIYGEENSVTDVYPIWPVINYALHRICVTDYFVGPESLLGFKTMFRAQQIKEEVQALILGETVHVERSLPFKEDDIRTLNYIVKSYICPPSGVEIFLRLLYSFGYLTQVKENKGLLLDQFKIPNNETYEELMKYTPV